MGGILYIHGEAGRAIRNRGASLLVADLLEVVGEFASGDSVQLVVRGRDGGQGLLGFGIVCFDAGTLRAALPGTSGAAGKESPVGADAVVIGTGGVAVRWPSQAGNPTST